MESEEEKQASAARRAVRNAAIAKIMADNAQAREARNALRWKAERDPLEYEAQKERQRREYQPRGGGPVRPYEKIVAATEAEHEEKAKVRDAERQRQAYANKSAAERQVKSDRIADEAWLARRREKSIPEDVIQAQLIVRLQERDAKRAAKALADADEAKMQDDPTYGMF